VRSRISLIGIAVSVVCLGGVIYWASRQEAPDLPSSASQLLALALAVGVYAANTVIRAERWHALLLRAGAQPLRPDTYALTVIGYTGNNVLPARAGDAVRVVLLAPRAATNRRTVIGTLLAERLLDVVVIILLFVVVGYGILGEVSNGNLEVIAAATAVALVGAGVAFAMLRRNERVMEFVRPVLSSTLSLRTTHGMAMLGLTVVIWAVESAVWIAVGESVGFGMDPIEGVYLVALSSIFSLIPSGPAYAGTQDSAAVIGIKAIGGTSAIAVSYLLMLRFVLVVPITTLGFLLLAARYGGISKLRAARLEAPAGADA
jgi:glycosyltransferase 2 family protein